MNRRLKQSGLGDLLNGWRKKRTLNLKSYPCTVQHLGNRSLPGKLNNGLMIRKRHKLLTWVNGYKLWISYNSGGDFSNNGLPFAVGTSFERADRASVLGTTITLRAAKLNVTGSGLEPDWNFKTATSALVNATIVEVWDGDLNNDVYLTLDIDGDSVEFTTSDIVNGDSAISDQGHEYWFDVPAFTNSVHVLIGRPCDSYL